MNNTSLTPHFPITHLLHLSYPFHCPLFFQVHPGDVLYYPKEHWHQTQNLNTPTVAITGTLVTHESHLTVKRELEKECAGAGKIFPADPDLCRQLKTCYAQWKQFFSDSSLSSNANANAKANVNTNVNANAANLANTAKSWTESSMAMEVDTGGVNSRIPSPNPSPHPSPVDIKSLPSPDAPPGQDCKVSQHSEAALLTESGGGVESGLDDDVKERGGLEGLEGLGGKTVSVKFENSHNFEFSGSAEDGSTLELMSHAEYIFSLK